MQKNPRLVLTALLGVAPAVCSADVLYDSIGDAAPPIGEGTASVEYTVAGMGYLTNFIAVPITVPASGWSIASLDVMMGTSRTVPAETQIPANGVGRLYFFPRSAATPTPTDDPQGGALVQFTFAELTNRRGITSVGGLSITLAPGDYWFGFAIVTPNPTGFFHPRWMFLSSPLAAGEVAPVSGTPGAWQPHTWLNGETPYAADYMMRLSGMVPSPSTCPALLLAFAAAARRRRR